MSSFRCCRSSFVGVEEDDSSSQHKPGVPLRRANSQKSLATLISYPCPSVGSSELTPIASNKREPERRYDWTTNRLLAARDETTTSSSCNDYPTMTRSSVLTKHRSTLEIAGHVEVGDDRLRTLPHPLSRAMILGVDDTEEHSHPIDPPATMSAIQQRYSTSLRTTETETAIVRPSESRSNLAVVAMEHSGGNQELFVDEEHPSRSNLSKFDGNMIVEQPFARHSSNGHIPELFVDEEQPSSSSSNPSSSHSDERSHQTGLLPPTNDGIAQPVRHSLHLDRRGKGVYWFENREYGSSEKRLGRLGITLNLITIVIMVSLLIIRPHSSAPSATDNSNPDLPSMSPSTTIQQSPTIIHTESLVINSPTMRPTSSGGARQRELSDSILGSVRISISYPDDTDYKAFHWLLVSDDQFVIISESSQVLFDRFLVLALSSIEDEWREDYHLLVLENDSEDSSKQEHCQWKEHGDNKYSWNCNNSDNADEFVTLNLDTSKRNLILDGTFLSSEPSTGISWTKCSLDLSSSNKLVEGTSTLLTEFDEFRTVLTVMRIDKGRTKLKCTMLAR